eukprot:545767_1
MSIHATKLTKQMANMLIFGYIHEYEKTTKQNVPVSIIPKILDFFPIFDEFKWQKGKDADKTLKIFNNDFRVANDTDNNRLCVSNHKISSTKCSEYCFEITLIDFNYSRNYSGIMIGIVADPISTSIEKWNTDFSTVNKDNAWTVYLSNGRQFCLYGPDTSCKRLTDPIYKFKVNDRIKISLDMINKKANLYYNEKFICIAFRFSNWNVVSPALALWNSEIALTNWSIVNQSDL